MSINKSSITITKLACFILAFTFLCGVTYAGESKFSYKGAVNGEVTEGRADFSYMKAISIWRLSLGKYNRETRESYNVNIFFSRDFQPKAGTFPIKFSYLNKKDTCGGSFIFRKDKNSRSKMLSTATNGTLTFETFGEKVKGTFKYDVTDGKELKETVSGSFELERGNAFKEVKK